MSRYLWSRLAWGLVRSGIGTMVHYWIFEVTVTKIGIARCLSTPENWKTPRRQQNTTKQKNNDSKLSDGGGVPSVGLRFCRLLVLLLFWFLFVFFSRCIERSRLAAEDETHVLLRVSLCFQPRTKRKALATVDERKNMTREQYRVRRARGNDREQEREREWDRKREKERTTDTTITATRTTQ